MMQVKRAFLLQPFGNVLVEFALAMPLLVVLFSGLYELTTYALLNNKLSRVATNLAFIITREDLSEAKLKAYLGKAEFILEPFEYENKGGVVVSHIAVDSNDNMFINWQDKDGLGISRIGQEGDAPSNLPMDITISGEQRMVIVEAFYDFRPLVLGSLLTAKELYATAVYAPRFGTMDTLLAG